MYRSSDSHFQRINTGIQAGPGAFDESRFIMTFLIILGVTEILCSFRLVLEGKSGKGIPEPSRLELLGKFLANNFALSDTEDNTFGPLNRVSIANLPSLRNYSIRNSPKVPRAKFLGSDDLFCFISICKLSIFKNPFATITSLPEHYYSFIDLFC